MTMDVDNEMTKVTTEKVKNPGRQEWGRKLGKMQKELKAKKLLEDVPVVQKNNFFKWEYAMTVTGILVALGALYYQKKSYEALKLKPAEPVKVRSSFSDF